MLEFLNRFISESAAFAAPWAVLLFNVAQTGIELHAYTTLSKSGISAMMNLREQHEFDSLTIDYDSVFSFLRKKT